MYKARARPSRVRKGDDVKDADDPRNRISPGRFEPVLRGREVRRNETGVSVGKVSLIALRTALLGGQRKRKTQQLLA